MGVSPLVWLSTALWLGVIGSAASVFGADLYRLGKRQEALHGA